MVSISPQLFCLLFSIKSLAILQIPCKDCLFATSSSISKNVGLCFLLSSSGRRHYYVRFFHVALQRGRRGLTYCHRCRKFGKHLQKRQLDIPEYGASFVNYKALKKVDDSEYSVHVFTLIRKTAHQATECNTHTPRSECSPSSA